MTDPDQYGKVRSTTYNSSKESSIDCLAPYVWKSVRLGKVINIVFLYSNLNGLVADSEPTSPKGKKSTGNNRVVDKGISLSLTSYANREV